MRSSAYKIYAPKCALPDCIDKVHYHERFLKLDGTIGWKWKTFCNDHRTVKRASRDIFLQSRGGCENRDARLGWVCGDPNTPSLTIDHWDGNRHNNDQDNLVVLCANCHNRKTKEFRDYENRYQTLNPNFHRWFDQT